MWYYDTLLFCPHCDQELLSKSAQRQNILDMLGRLLNTVCQPGTDKLKRQHRLWSIPDTENIWAKNQNKGPRFLL